MATRCYVPATDTVRVSICRNRLDADWQNALVLQVLTSSVFAESNKDKVVTTLPVIEHQNADSDSTKLNTDVANEHSTKRQHR